MKVYSELEIEQEIVRLEKKQAKWDRQDAKQRERQAYVQEHNLACWECGSRMNEWASAGPNKWGTPSAWCIRCQRGRWRAKVA